MPASTSAKNKKIAALLAGASLFTIAARASAGTVFIPPSSSVIAASTNRVVITGAANIAGDVTNQSTIGLGHDSNPVAIQSGAIITGAFVNEGVIQANSAVVNFPGNATALAAGIVDTAPGVPRINNTANGVIAATASASAAGRALAGAGGVVQAEAFLGAVSDTVTNSGQISAHATARALGTAAAGGVGALQAQLAVSGHEDIANTGSILGQGIATGTTLGGAASTAACGGRRCFAGDRCPHSGPDNFQRWIRPH